MTLSGRSDNLTTVIREIRKEQIPADQIKMDVPIEQLRQLPEDASFSSRSGRAMIDLRVAGDTLRATATCDSLERMVEYYEDMYMSAVEAIEAKDQQLESFAAQKYDPGGAWIKLSFAAGVIVGGAITAVIYKLKSQLWQK